MAAAPRNAKELFLAALEIPAAAERAAFLDKSCSGDDALRQRVEDLLRAYGEPDGPLDKLAAALAPTQLGETIREQPGTVIGPYKLMEQIGEGGFGLVFVAEQQQPIRRKVALKIIKPGMDTRDVIARFKAEQQALALMDHPNIARVLDAGTTESGRPYFVMELVRGIPITDYCDRSQLTPRERLELFIPVCNAIQHAHLKGIIHRDIKPSNVLVTLHDGKPVVKVIDFGVAKALHQSLTDRTIYTRFAQMIGTPLYMSPEQAEMSGLDIDTRTDVYSLGVLLYELLTGTTPFDKQRLALAAYDELLRIIREEEPPKPSVRLARSTDSLPSIAAQRKTEPAKLSKMFYGDLDWIAMKSLEKDRTRRYETANAFAADVLRYLNDEPVEACPPSAGYRFRKFARKHRRPVIALTTIVAALVLGIAGTTWGLFLAKSAEQAAGESEKKAIDALGQTTKERDAKQTALLAEAAERDRAERQLANGLLRPIGFSDDHLDPVELRCFVDWSAIKESQLKLRVLEIALEDPDTALRVARRAKRVIQACVGLSPTRRARAIKFVCAKQRDLTADPRIRVGACWLALELGSADLPAWGESCDYLADPKNKCADRFGELVAFAASRSDPQQVAQLNPEPLLTMLLPLTDYSVLQTFCDVLAPRLNQSQAKRACDVLIAFLEKSEGNDVFYWASHVLVALAPRLEPVQITRTADALIAILEKSNGDQVRRALNPLAALVPRLNQSQAKRACDALIAFLEKSKDDQVPSASNGFLGGSAPPTLAASSAALAAPAPRMEPTQAKRAWDALIAILQKPNDVNVVSGASKILAALVPRVEPAQVTHTADALIAILQKSKDDQVPYPAVLISLAAPAPRMKPTQVTHTADAAIAILENSRGNNVVYGVSDMLVTLAPRLEPAQVTHIVDAAIAILEKSDGHNTRAAASQVLVALVPRLQPAQVTRTADTLIAFREKSNKGDYESEAPLAALVPRLEPAKVGRTADFLIAILEKSTDDQVRLRALYSLNTLVPRLETARVKRAWDALMAIGKKSENLDIRRFVRATPGYPTDALAALVPRLEEVQVTHTADALIAILEKSEDNDVVSWASHVLVALAPRLEAAQAKRVGDALIEILKRSENNSVRDGQPDVLIAFVPRLDQSQVNRAWDALLAILEQSKYQSFASNSERFVALAPRLDASHAKRGWDSLIAILEEGQQGHPAQAAYEAFVALAPRLEPASRDKLSTKAMTSLLDYSAIFGPPYYNGGDPPDLRAILIARSILSPRSLAKLLSHPGCVEQLRQGLLHRFEELVFFDGKPTFGKADDASAFCEPETPGGKQHRFHNLHDAAAWIQQNWPDFDLETNCPVTWRGSR